jgi:hypothetical protein
MFKQGDFLLQLFGVLVEAIPRHDVLLLSGRDSTPLVIVEHHVVLRDDDFSAIVEKDTGSII